MTNVQLQINEIGQGAFITMADTVAQTLAQGLLQGLSFIGLWLIFCLFLTFFGKILLDLSIAFLLLDFWIDLVV